MILYFTGTGNSRFVAEVLGKHLDDEVVSLNEILKQEKQWRFISKKPYIIVAPVYAWRLPKRIEEMLKKAEFAGNQKVYVVVTMGTHFDRANEYARKIFETKKMTYMGFAGLAMPDNYVISDTMMKKEEAIQKIKRALPHLKEIANKIKAQDTINDVDEDSHPYFKSGFANWGFNTFMTRKKPFTVSEDCIQCGLCVRECPVNNIDLTQAGKIVFSNKCMLCLACIQKCPKQAIDYHHSTSERGRYVFPKDAFGNGDDEF